MDTNTINRFLALSEDTSKLSWKLHGCYEDHADRFDFWPQVLCGTGLNNRCFWEVEWGGGVYISVAYEGMRRRGHTAASWFGRNAESWSLRCADGENYCIYHDKKKTSIVSPDSTSNRVGVYLDYPAGTLSFYCVSGDRELHLHTFRTDFSQRLRAGFGLCCSSFDHKPCYVRLMWVCVSGWQRGLCKGIWGIATVLEKHQKSAVHSQLPPATRCCCILFYVVDVLNETNDAGVFAI